MNAILAIYASIIVGSIICWEAGKYASRRTYNRLFRRKKKKDLEPGL
jgi:hypothetical protein